MFIDSIDEVFHHLCRIIMLFYPLGSILILASFYTDASDNINLLFTGREVKSKLIS